MTDILTASKLLTVFIRPLDAGARADECLERMEKEGAGQQIIETHDEAFFMRLRRRVAEKPELADKIEVIWLGGEGPERVGLLFEDELRWPRGFMNALWDEEIATKVARQSRTASAGRSPSSASNGETV